MGKQNKFITCVFMTLVIASCSLYTDASENTPVSDENVTRQVKTVVHEDWSENYHVSMKCNVLTSSRMEGSYTVCNLTIMSSIPDTVLEPAVAALDNGIYMVAQ